VENSNFAEADPRAPRSPHGLLNLNLISGSNFGVRVERLEVFIVILGPLEEQEVKLMKAIQEAAKEQKIPKGVGPLTFEILRREVGDWKRFNNRRQVSSYTGLCPRESSQRHLAR